MTIKKCINNIDEWVKEELQLVLDKNGFPRFTTKSGLVYCVRCGIYLGKLKDGKRIGDDYMQLRLLCDRCRKTIINQAINQIKRNEKV